MNMIYIHGIFYEQHLVKHLPKHPGGLNFNSLFSILINVSIRTGTSRFKIGSNTASSPGPSVLSIIIFSICIISAFSDHLKVF